VLEAASLFLWKSGLTANPLKEGIKVETLLLADRASVIVCVDTDVRRRKELCEQLAVEGCAVTPSPSLKRAHQDLSPRGVIVLSCRSAREALDQLRSAETSTRVVLWVSEGDEKDVIAAFRNGVSDYVHRSEGLPALLDAVRRAHGPLTPAQGDSSQDPIIGNSPAMRQLKELLPRIAASECVALITGETGCGKELVAQCLHRQSARSAAPLISLNCAAIPDSLLESELFGHERGAFTGADAQRQGKVELAQHGTLFLDEVGDMTMLAQAKILRVLECREVDRLGGRKSIPVNIRVIAATNQELETLVEEGRFRKDLFYRLNVARISIPPLRERLDDLLPLAMHYIERFNQTYGRCITGVASSVVDVWSTYSWPGNIRELKNVIESAFLSLAEGDIQLEHLPSRLASAAHGAAPMPVQSEKQRLIRILEQTHWNKSRAAEALRWSRMTLYRKLAKYGLDTEARVRVRDSSLAAGA
jgi:DNA-binding NtrC family response regulator